MIAQIQIKKALVFSEITLDFKPGLNVFSGSSGSGKSIFFNELLAAFGLADTNAQTQICTLILSPNTHTQKNALLKIPNIKKNPTKSKTHSASSAIKNIDSFPPSSNYPLNEKLCIQILKKERTKFFLNHTPISKRSLQSLLSPFIRHICVKNATEFSPENILQTLDNFIISQDATHREHLYEVKNKFIELQDMESELNRILKEESNLNELKEIARFEIKKIEAINPKVGEYEELILLKKNLSKKEKLESLLHEALEAFVHIKCIQDALKSFNLEQESFLDAILQAQQSLQEESLKLQTLSEIQSEDLLNRISALSSLNSQYGSIQAALTHLQNQREKLKDYENREIHKEHLLKKKEEVQKKYLNLCEILHKKRLQYQGLFEKTLDSFCVSLKLKKTQLVLSVDHGTGAGYTQATLLLNSTPVNHLSMGEYNRLRLALMCLDGDIHPRVGILILDEIDANLSGEESEGVALVLKKLSKNYQIFTISHQPHIPILSDAHYLVKKQDEQSTITLLNNEGKIKEIARMISGSHISQEALDFAKRRLGL